MRAQHASAQLVDEAEVSLPVGQGGGDRFADVESRGDVGDVVAHGLQAREQCLVALGQVAGEHAHDRLALDAGESRRLRDPRAQSIAAGVREQVDGSLAGLAGLLP